MKFDVTTKLTDFDGKPIIMPDEKPLTVRSVIVANLMAYSPETRDADRNVSGEEKLERFTLARRVQKHDVVDMTAETVAKLKKLIGDNASPLIAGQMFEFFEESALKTKKGA